MKTFKFYIFFLILLSVVTYSQSLNQLVSLSTSKKNNPQKRQMDDTTLTFKSGESPLNPWTAGIQASYNFGIASKDFADRFSPNGKVVRIAYPNEVKETDRFRIYTSVNLADLRTASGEDISRKLQDLQEASEGLNISFTPLYFWGEPKKWQFSVSAGIGYRLSAFKDIIDSSNIYINQGLLSPFLEIISPYEIFKAPVTLSVGSTFKVIANKKEYVKVFGEEESFIASFEVTAIIPIYNNVGIVFHDTFSKNTTNQFRVGAIISAGF